MSTSSFIAANIIDLNCFLFNINLRGEEDKSMEEMGKEDKTTDSEMEEEAANDIDDAFLKDIYPINQYKQRILPINPPSISRLLILSSHLSWNIGPCILC